VILISEFRSVEKFCSNRNIPFDYSFRGSKYAAYRLKPDGSRVIRLDSEYYVVSAKLYLILRRYLVALRKGDGSDAALFYL
jgi:hypothetical protein